MLKNLLKEIVVLIAGKQAEQIVDLLDGKKYVNEFIIAKKLELTINQTRNILYKISDQGLVSFIRKKDKRKGWYTYFWKLEVIKCLEFLRTNILKKIEQVNYQIKSRETKEFYVCETCNIEFNEENALLHNFTCNECGNIVSRKDNSPVIKNYNRDLEKLKRELASVEEEWKLERDKLDKIKVKEAKKEDELKKKVAKEKSELRKKAKLSKTKKEVPSKKVKKNIKKEVKNKKKK
jgi:transcription factor E